MTLKHLHRLWHLVSSQYMVLRILSLGLSNMLVSNILLSRLQNKTLSLGSVSLLTLTQAFQPPSLL